MRVIILLTVLYLVSFNSVLNAQGGVDFCNLSTGEDYCKKVDKFIKIYKENLDRGEVGNKGCYKGMKKGLTKLNENFKSGDLFRDKLIIVKKIAEDLKGEKCYKDKKLVEILEQTVIFARKNIEVVECDPGEPASDCDDDGIPNGKDCEPKNPDIGGIGYKCDDNNPETENDAYNENCECEGSKKGKEMTAKGTPANKNSSKNRLKSDKQKTEDSNGIKDEESKTKNRVTPTEKVKRKDKKNTLGLEFKDLLWLLLIPLLFALFRISKLTKDLRAVKLASSKPHDYQKNMDRLKELEAYFKSSPKNSNKGDSNIQVLQDRIDAYKRKISVLERQNAELQKDSEELNRIYAKGANTSAQVTTNNPSQQNAFSTSGFFSSPNRDGERYFKHSDLSPVRKQGSIYEFMKISDSVGEFRLIQDIGVQQKAIKSYDYVLAPACDSVNGFTPSAKGIENVENGKLSLINGNWKIIQNCKIKFI